jgi:hypothetical protein
MYFPVMQFETKYGVDYRVGATEANIRSGSKLIGYLPAVSKPTAIQILKDCLYQGIRFKLLPKERISIL